MAQIVKDGEIVEEVETEEIQEEVEAEQPEEAEDGQEEETIEPKEVDDEAQFWQDIDKEDSEDVPVKTHLRIKQKLKGRIKERESENEELRRELEELKKRLPSSSEPLKRPRENDFDTIEEYENALEKYENDRLERITQQNRQAEEARKLNESRVQSVEKHYERADTFVSKFGIAPEKYKNADEQIRKAVETVMPGMGEGVTDHFISLLGEGSEKVLFRVGAKPELLREFQSLLMEDKTGLKAGVFLGRQMELITNPKIRTSKAPAPSPNLKGDEANNESGKAKALYKKYKEAHKSGKAQEAWNAKKDARLAGVDVSRW